MVKIVENTVGPADINIATTDENLTVEQMFQQVKLPSLGREIFSVQQMHGPTAALFNVRNRVAQPGNPVTLTNANDFQLFRSEVACYPSVAISTGVTQEMIQDLRAQYGLEANKIIGSLLRGLANEAENAHTLAFLTSNSLVGPSLTLSPAVRANAELTLFTVTKRVQELVLKINSIGLRTFEAFAVLPAQELAGVMSLANYAQGEVRENNSSLFVAKIGKTKFYLNPDPLSTTAYVGLLDPLNMSKSSGVFSPYEETVVNGVNPDTGAEHYHIYNRYAITASPLHIPGEEMFHQFNIV